MSFEHGDAVECESGQMEIGSYAYDQVADVLLALAAAWGDFWDDERTDEE